MSEVSGMQQPACTAVQRSVNPPVIQGNRFLSGEDFYWKTTAQTLKYYTRYKNRPKQGNRLSYIAEENRLLMGRAEFRRGGKKQLLTDIYRLFWARLQERSTLTFTSLNY